MTLEQKATVAEEAPTEPDMRYAYRATNWVEHHTDDFKPLVEFELHPLLAWEDNEGGLSVPATLNFGTLSRPFEQRQVSISLTGAHLSFHGDGVRLVQGSLIGSAARSELKANKYFARVSGGSDVVGPRPVGYRHLYGEGLPDVPYIAIVEPRANGSASFTFTIVATTFQFLVEQARVVNGELKRTPMSRNRERALQALVLEQRPNTPDRRVVLAECCWMRTVNADPAA